MRWDRLFRLFNDLKHTAHIHPPPLPHTHTHPLLLPPLPHLTYITSSIPESHIIVNIFIERLKLLLSFPACLTALKDVVVLFSSTSIFNFASLESDLLELDASVVSVAGFTQSSRQTKRVSGNVLGCMFGMCGEEEEDGGHPLLIKQKQPSLSIQSELSPSRN